jgi:hypothetical protein
MIFKCVQTQILPVCSERPDIQVKAKKISSYPGEDENTRDNLNLAKTGYVFHENHLGIYKIDKIGGIIKNPCSYLFIFGYEN